jgi:cell wall-associated NlpC family hydrolase
MVTGNPSLIGEGSPAPAHARPAAPVSMAIPQGTPVTAVTAGTFKTSGSTVVLKGADGATYTYKNVTGAAGSGKTKAGTKLGTSGPGGLTFSITVPDVKGPVDADEAMQAWASGLTVNVRSLPSTIAAATAPAKDQVLLVTDPGSSAIAGTLSHSLSGALVAVRTVTLDAARKQVASAKGGKLVVVALSSGTPAEAAALASLLPAGHQLLWVAPPGTTAKQAAAYQALSASRPAFRVETLPQGLTPHQQAAQAKTASVPTQLKALAAVRAISARQAAAARHSGWPAADQQAAGTLTADYATTAYRLYTISTEAASALSYAEQQLGKPYQWAAAGPGSFDCSGLVMDALAQAGVTVPHNANSQWQQTRNHTVPANQLQPGDLVFFAGSDGTVAAPGHVGIYVGSGEMIDAPHTGANVRLDPVSSIGGYTGATDPYSAASGAGSSLLSAALPGGLAVPSALSQYQAFAQQLSGATWGPSQFQYLYLLWQRESGWNPMALNPLSGAFGIPQSLPAGKMASAGLDWQTDPYTQIIWGIGYIRSAYGTPQNAWAHEGAYGWY